MVDYRRREDEATLRARRAGRRHRPVARLPRAEMAQAGLCRRHHQLCDRSDRDARFQQPAGLGSDDASATTGVNQNGEPVISFVSTDFRRAPPEQAMTASAASPTSRRARKARRAPRARRRLRRACAARRLYRSDLRHAADLAGTNSASAMPRSGCCRRVLRHAGRLADSRRACWPSGSARRWCWRSAPRSPASAIASPASAAAFVTLVAALFVGGLGASTQHPLASVAGRARLRRPALAEGARHLQFRRRHRQDDAAGGGLAAARGAAVARGAGAAGRHRRAGGDRRSFC